MLHVLSMGHFDHAALDSGLIEVIKPLDFTLTYSLLGQLGKLSKSGAYTLGGFPVHVREGYIECVWLAARPVPEAITFGQRLHEETGCDVLDLKGGKVLYKANS
jgi:hypothetical protein